MCQNTNQELISSGGDTFSSQGIQLNWSIGEIATETYENSETTLTQGFHQGNLIISSIPNYPEIADLSVYPNPTTDLVVIDFENFKPSETAQYQIFTTDGKLIKDGNLTKKTTIDFTLFLSGTYILKIKNYQAKSKAYKIIKQ
jgi:hypothetical protein